MIWDCIMLAGEVDVLRCRLETIGTYSQDITHVIVEAAVTNHGVPKPLTLIGPGSGLLRNYAGSPWVKPVVYLTTHDLAGPGPWEREHQLRDLALTWLRKKAQPEDVVLIADVDEVPSERAVNQVSRALTPWTFSMTNIMLSLDRALPSPMPTSVAVPWSDSLTSIAEARDRRHLYPVIDNAGWHLSWLGGPEAVAAKQAMHCHSSHESSVMFQALVSNDDIPPWCKENAPETWWSHD